MPGDQDGAKRLINELLRVGREQDALAVEIMLRLNAGGLDMIVARIFASFPPALEGRLPETETLLAALRSVAVPLTNDEIENLTDEITARDETDVASTLRGDDGWSIFETDSFEHSPYEIQYLQDYDSGDDLIMAYLSETGSHDHPNEVGDQAAWWRVRKKAYEGDKPCLATLAFLLLNESQEEYQTVLRAWSRWTPTEERSTDWPERELHLVRSVIMGDPYSHEDVVPRSVKCSKCGRWRLPLAGEVGREGDVCVACSDTLRLRNPRR